MFANMTVGRKIGLGFFIVLVLLTVVAAWSFVGIGRIITTSGEVTEGNDLRAEMLQREIDHFKWAAAVSDFMHDDTVTELAVQTDPHKCALGQWYYGDGREKAEEGIPALKPILARIEEPHNHLHASAIEIAKTFRQADVELGNFLREKKTDHMTWANAVAQVFADTSINKLEVQMDPTKCSLGSWMLSHETALLKQKNPQLAALMTEMEAPHRKLHESAQHIQQLLGEGKRDDAAAYYTQTTLPAAHETLEAVNSVIAWHNAEVKGLKDANGIFGSQTKPALETVQGLLREINKVTVEHVVEDEQHMAATGKTTGLAVTAVGTVALVLGSVLAFFIGRGIVKVLRRIIDGLNEGGEQVASASGQVSSASQSLAEGASEQAASLEETSSSLEEMASMTRQNADNAKQANALAQESRSAAEKGSESMDRMKKAIDDIKKSSDETAKIIKVIDEIAFQTNLLALNAAVEAARAGEAGKGFAVVAEEVRNLAQRSAEAAKNTASMIEDSVKNADNGVSIASEVANALEGITTSAKKVDELVAEIAAASQEQAQGIDQVNEAVAQMDKVTQQNAANAEESASASEELSAQAQALTELVGQLVVLVGGGKSSRGLSGAGRARTSAAEVQRQQEGLTERIHSRLSKVHHDDGHDKKDEVKPRNRMTEPEVVVPLDDNELARF